MRVRSSAIVILCALAAAPAVAWAQDPAAPAPAPAPTTLPAGVIAPDVSIDGIPVGGATLAQARVTLLQQRVAPRLRPLTVRFKSKRVTIQPQSAGYSVRLDDALAKALKYGRTAVMSGPVDVPLVQRVDRTRLGLVLTNRTAAIAIPARDAVLTFRGSRPRVSRAQMGYEVDIAKAVPLVATAMIARTSDEVRAPGRRVRPDRIVAGPSIVVSRSDRTLTLYRDERRVRVLRVAVGMSRYPTPRGLFRIIEMQRNPTWFPPDSPWAKGLGPVPPGGGNPLGTRWMGTSAPGIGIHGTPASWSIGTAASHGCIRMYINQAEWLYARVEVGTPVLIV